LRDETDKDQAMRPNLFLIVNVLALFLPASQGGTWAAETIVGTWAPDTASCTSGQDAIVIIKPLSISGAITCNFTSVSRSGNVVAWKGSCMSPEGDERPGGMKATLSGKELTLEGSGLGAGPLLRCK
jgi:hypothetical protein